MEHTNARGRARPKGCDGGDACRHDQHTRRLRCRCGSLLLPAPRLPAEDRLLAWIENLPRVDNASRVAAVREFGKLIDELNDLQVPGRPIPPEIARGCAMLAITIEGASDRVCAAVFEVLRLMEADRRLKDATAERLLSIIGTPEPSTQASQVRATCPLCRRLHTITPRPPVPR